MRKYAQKFFFCFAIATLICGCSTTQPKISDALAVSFGELVSIDDMNQDFHIYIDSANKESLGFDSTIKIAFRNISGKEVFFPVGHGIRLFLARDDKWIEIQNNVEYYGEGSLLQTKSEQTSGGRIVTLIRPVLPPDITTDEGNQEILRIVIVGQLMSNGEKTDTPVGAYIDVFIN